VRSTRSSTNRMCENKRRPTGRGYVRLLQRGHTRRSSSSGPSTILRDAVLGVTDPSLQSQQKEWMNTSRWTGLDSHHLRLDALLSPDRRSRRGPRRSKPVPHVASGTRHAPPRRHVREALQANRCKHGFNATAASGRPTTMWRERTLNDPASPRSVYPLQKTD
jgi:hypothetical protein